MKKRRLLNRRIHNVPAVMALGIMVMAAAQARAASGKLDLSTPRAAVEVFNGAFRSADIISARAATISDPRSIQIAEALIGYGAHLGRLINDQGKSLEFIRASDASFTINGGDALVLEAGQPVAAIRQVDSQWKLDFTATLPADTTDTAAATIAQLTRIIQRAGGTA